MPWSPPARMLSPRLSPTGSGNAPLFLVGERTADSARAKGFGDDCGNRRQRGQSYPDIATRFRSAAPPLSRRTRSQGRTERALRPRMIWLSLERMRPSRPQRSMSMRWRFCASGAVDASFIIRAGARIFPRSSRGRPRAIGPGPAPCDDLARRSGAWADRGGMARRHRGASRTRMR